ncbi:MFS transporter [Ktedonosporobacter rubrisoli]|uniref:MFS transporter n=1 Tax=Ktedonosporobacter rubrisoli TaxID=2509675 RepID=A0A4P6K2W2_KTERU|nr:MFS transporter [Ktedonosporobacter rubrisoli]QBD81826.1 MFS transporter [Ktedonosporobacter rubrisoli]
MSKRRKPNSAKEARPGAEEKTTLSNEVRANSEEKPASSTARPRTRTATRSRAKKPTTTNGATQATEKVENSPEAASTSLSEKENEQAKPITSVAEATPAQPDGETISAEEPAASSAQPVVTPVEATPVEPVSEASVLAENVQPAETVDLAVEGKQEDTTAEASSSTEKLDQSAVQPAPTAADVPVDVPEPVNSLATPEESASVEAAPVAAQPAAVAETESAGEVSRSETEEGMSAVTAEANAEPVSETTSSVVEAVQAEEEEKSEATEESPEAQEPVAVGSVASQSEEPPVGQVDEEVSSAEKQEPPVLAAPQETVEAPGESKPEPAPVVEEPVASAKQKEAPEARNEAGASKQKEPALARAAALASEVEKVTRTKGGRPSIVRYIILGGICLLYLIAYVDRTTISVTASQIIKEFHFTATEMGLVFSAFSLTYALFAVPVATQGDRFGPRRVLSILMGVWSVFTILTGIVTSFVWLIIVRLLFGIGESGSFAVSTRALATWFPPSARGFLQGTTHAASRIGAAVSAPIIVAIVLLFHDWRASFYILGAIGLVWAILFLFFFRDKPADVAAVNKEELDIIEYGREVSTNVSGTSPAVPWRRVLKSKDIWALAVTQFFYSYVFWIFLTWMPTYLQNARHFSFAQLGIVASLPLLGGVLGDLVGGWASDALYKKTGNFNLARRSTIIVSYIGAAACTIPAVLVSSPLVAELLIIGTMFMLECAVSNTWAMGMDIGGEYYSATVAGFISTGFGFGGILAPTIFGVLKDMTGSWIPGFISGAVLLFIGVFIVLLVNANNKIMPDEQNTGDAGALSTAASGD